MSPIQRTRIISERVTVNYEYFPDDKVYIETEGGKVLINSTELKLINSHVNHIQNNIMGDKEI